MENYYAGFGETWERLALIKARGIAGSGELAYEFLRQHQPFIYPKSTTHDLLDEIASIKRRIERDIVGTENLERDVKLGRGGIRDIEFIVQTLQLIYGARHPFLQEPSMLKALRALRELDLLPSNEVLTLDNTYRFLRRVEHRLQIEAEQQTHVVPLDAEALRRLALSLRFSSSEDFTAALHERMRAVRPIFQRIISKTPATRTEAPHETDLEIFHDQRRAAKAFTDLAQGATGFHIAPRTRQIFSKLRPLLIGWLTKTADPDATLNQFARFVEAYGLRSLFFELLVENPRLLELFMKTLDASRFAGELLIRRPQLLEDITRDPAFHQPRSVAENLRRLELFVADDNRAAQKLMIAMTQSTTEGNIWAVDARLRPEGENGPLVCSIETYQWYYTNRAQPWELQALTRARAVSGHLQGDFMQIAKTAWRRAGQNPNLSTTIDGMLERIRRERGSGSDFLDLKTGCGGIIEAEFLVQALQLGENIWEQNLERAVDRLRQHGYMNDFEVTRFKKAHALLRRCELVLRRYDNRSISMLPSDPEEQRRFAVRLGYGELDAFRRDYIDAREAIHALYERHVQNKSL